MVLVIMFVCRRMIVRRVGFPAVNHYAGFARADAAAVYGFKGERCAEIERRGGLLQQRGRDAGADEGAEQHVSTDAGEAFEIADAHGGFYLPLLWRTASGRISFMEPER